MPVAIQRIWNQLSWAQQFLLTSFCVFLVGMVALGCLIGEQIERGVVQQTGANSALYVSSVVEPKLQELATSTSISPEHQAELTQLFRETPLGQHITTMKVWDTTGRLVYATETENIGRTFPIDDDLKVALQGWVSAEIGNTDKPENTFDIDQGTRQLETYSPLRRTGTNQIIAVVEFYQHVDALERDIASARLRSWLWIVVGASALYLVLAGFVRYGSTTIQQQQHALSEQVNQLSLLLNQNTELHERVQRATRETTAINERFLRRISADLHDGPAQDLGFALLRLDQLRPDAALLDPTPEQRAQANSHFETIQKSLWHAIQEIRAISAGLGLPELGPLSLADTARRAIRAHERRTNSQVTATIGDLPVPLALKITVYRLIQEALQNAYRHGGGIHQQVKLAATGSQLTLMIADQGPGFEQQPQQSTQHLGLVGMRERVESLGGRFWVTSVVGVGTQVYAQFDLEQMQDGHEQ